MEEYLDMNKIIKLKELPELARANMLILIVFKDKVDKGKEPYIRHLNRVSSFFKDDTEKVIALLHDLVEDTSFTFEDLEFLGFSPHIISSLKLLTNDLKNYDDYIDRLIKSDNLLAKKIKIADLLDNMNLNRLKSITPNDFKRIKNKYVIAYNLLIEDLERRILND